MVIAAQKMVIAKNKWPSLRRKWSSPKMDSLHLREKLPSPKIDGLRLRDKWCPRAVAGAAAGSAAGASVGTVAESVAWAAAGASLGTAAGSAAGAMKNEYTMIVCILHVYNSKVVVNKGHILIDRVHKVSMLMLFLGTTNLILSLER